MRKKDVVDDLENRFSNYDLEEMLNHSQERVKRLRKMGRVHIREIMVEQQKVDLLLILCEN